MVLLGSTKEDVDKDKNGENVLKLESVEVVLVLRYLVERLSTHIKYFIQFCSKQRIWTVNKYFASFFNNDEHS